MKKIKFLLPVLAFLFAVAAAFASKGTKNETAATYYWKNTSTLQCQQCTALPTMVSECETTNDGEVCKCEIANSPDLGSTTNFGQNCNVVFRPAER